jgi:hypothetical protein
MQVLYQDSRFLPAYSQVGLTDAEHPDSYPQWSNDPEKAIGPRGIAVGTISSTGHEFVIVTVYQGAGNPGKHHLCTVEITVGNKGLLIGTVIFTPLPWPPGRVHVSVYIEPPGAANVRSVDFVLEQWREGRA